MNNREVKPFVIILGMHRSGTSFLARGLNLCGVYLGKSSSFISSEWNPAPDNLRGHWENKHILELTEKSLFRNNGSWENIPDNIEIGDEIGNEVSGCCKKLLDESILAAGFKDSRGILLFDSWKKFLPKNFVVVGIFRDPLKVAESLKQRNGFSYEKSLDLWKSYNQKLLEIIENNNGFLIDFDLPTENIFSEIHLISSKIGLVGDIDFSKVFIAKLKHSDKTKDSTYSLPSEINELYSRLKRRTSKNAEIPSLNIKPSREELEQFVKSFLNDQNEMSLNIFEKFEKNKSRIENLFKTSYTPLKLLLEIYNKRSDLQASYPEVKNGDYTKIIQWAINVIEKRYKDEKTKKLLSVYLPWYKESFNSLNFVKSTKKPIESKLEYQTFLKVKILDFLSQYTRIKTILDYNSSLKGILSEIEEKGYQISSNVENQNDKNNLEKSITKFDVIFSDNIFQSKSPLESAKKIFSLLNQNGFLLLVNNFGEIEKEKMDVIRQKTLLNELAKIGFTTVKEIGFKNSNKIFVLAKYKPVDIIVTIHNAPLETKACLESVIKYWDTSPNRLMIVDDASTDPQIENILKNYENVKYAFFTKHKKPVGNIRSENEIIEKSENDVILLNSDTIVTPNWISKLIEAAYMKENIATVTPLSNKGSTFSWPLKMPQTPDITLNEIAKVVDEHSQKLFPEIPVGVGFCLYIKREIFDEVGLLDVETFGMGYGEENDLCLKAKKIGYQSILADNIFIYHKGGASFKAVGYISEKDITKMENEQKLIQRHPHFPQINEEFQNSGTMYEIRKRLDFWLARMIISKRKKIMFVLHNKIFKNVIGGTEIHVENLVTNLRKQYCVYAVSGNEADRVYVQEFIDDYEFEYFFPIKHSLNTISNPLWKEFFDVITDVFDPDIVHIQHVLHSALDIITSSKEREKPVILSVHDFYILCPNLNLLNANTGEFCDLPSSMSVCNSCLEKRFGLESFSLSDWREKNSKFMKECDVVIYFSDTTKKLFERLYSPKKGIIIPHGINVSSFEKLEFKKTDSKFSIGFIGYMAPQKGSKIIKKIVPTILEKNIDVHFYGPVDSSFIKTTKKRKNLHFHGRFDNSNELIKKLKESEVKTICILSTWPETFSYILSELWVAGIPAIVTPFGAPADRVRKTNGGIVLDDLSADTIVKTITDLAKSPKKYQTLVSNVSKIKIKNVKEMVNDYKKLYNSYIKTKKNWNELNDHIIYQFYNVSTVIQSKELEKFSIDFTPLLEQTSTSERNQILSKKTWEVLDTLYPKKDRFSRMMKLNTALSIYAEKYGVKNSIKRILQLIKNGKVSKIP